MSANRCGRVFFAFISCASSAPFLIKPQGAHYKAAALVKRWCVTDIFLKNILSKFSEIIPKLIYGGACLLQFLSSINCKLYTLLN